MPLDIEDDLLVLAIKAKVGCYNRSFAASQAFPRRPKV